MPLEGDALDNIKEFHGEETGLPDSKPIKVPSLKLPSQTEKIKKCIDYVNEHPEDEETKAAVLNLFRQLEELLELRVGLKLKQEHLEEDKELSSLLATLSSPQNLATVGHVAVSGDPNVHQQLPDLSSKNLAALPFNHWDPKSKNRPVEPTVEHDSNDVGEVSETNDAGSLQQASLVSNENEPVNSSVSENSHDVPHVKSGVNSPLCFYCVITKGRTAKPITHLCLDCDEHICDRCKGRHEKGMKDHHIVKNSNLDSALVKPIVCLYRFIRPLMRRFFGADPVVPSDLLLCQECLTIHNKRSKHIHMHKTEPLVDSILVSWNPEANVEEVIEKLMEKNEILLNDQEFIDLLCQYDLALLAQVASEIYQEKLKLELKLELELIEKNHAPDDTLAS